MRFVSATTSITSTSQAIGISALRADATTGVDIPIPVRAGPMAIYKKGGHA